MKENKQFIKTRFTLSLWYSFILFVILIAFSIALSFIYNNDVTRIVLRQDFGNVVPRTLSLQEKKIIIAQVRELRSRSLLDLLIIDLVTLLVGGALSYFLAGKTLAPIQKNMVTQKLFIADASHELKSPITSIQTACEVVLRSSTKTKDDYKKVLEQVHEQSQRLGRLVDDLLLLSVLDTAHVKKIAQQCSLSQIVGDQVEIMKPVFMTADIAVKEFITSNVIIWGDADKLQQLVVILLDNALKFTPSKGKITIQVKSIPQPELRIEDTGIGISQEKQKSIFRRFYQGDPSHTGQGAGLGLAIAESIMNLHKGKIGVKSTEGKGSIFTCVFPKFKNATI